MRAFLRKVFAVLLVASSAATAWSVWEISREPILADAIHVKHHQLSAALDQMMAKHVSRSTIEQRLNDLLSAEPRNWVAIDGVMAVVKERDLQLSPPVLAHEQNLRAKDHSVVVGAQRCAACMWDAEACNLSAVLFCRVADLTPIGDVLGLAREGGRYATGAEVDTIDLTLSAVGLAATGATVFSTGATYSVKVGASVAKTARRMGVFSNKLTNIFTDAAKSIDWRRISSVRSRDELMRVIKTPRVAEASRLVGDMGSIYDRLGLARGLHVLKHIDSPSEARHLLRVSEASGPEKTVGHLELLGKSRVIRASARLSSTAWLMLSGVLGLLTALAGLMSSAIFSATIRLTHRFLRAQPG